MSKQIERPIIVAQIMGKWLGGGVESVIMNYYRNIDRTKIQFDFICDSDSTRIPYDEIKRLGGRVIIIPPYQKVFKYLKELKRVFRENKYKVVHSNINTLSVFPLYAAWVAKVPVRIAHNHSTSNKKDFKKAVLKNILRPFSKLFATEYFACSSFAGKWLYGNKAVKEKQVTIVNNAIDLHKFNYDLEIRIKKRKSLGINEDMIVIGHIGRFVTPKNHDFLIDIFKEIHAQNEHTMLLLVGNGPLINKVKNKVKKYTLEKCVVFLGQRDDVNELYQVFDAFVLPSLYEGLPVVGIEAQATGNLCFLSKNMTDETKILESTTMIDLNYGAKKWADIILEGVKNYKKKDTSDELTKFGFNITNQAKILEEKYIRLHNKAN